MVEEKNRERGVLSIEGGEKTKVGGSDSSILCHLPNTQSLMMSLQELMWFITPLIVTDHTKGSQPLSVNR